MELLQALGEWPLAQTLRRSSTIYPLVNAAHIFSLGLLVATVVTIDLRILGLFRASPLHHLALPLERMAAFGLAGAILTGFLLFTVRPEAYATNPALQIKLALIVLGLGNAIWLRASTPWKVALRGGEHAGRLKVQALLSIVIWLSAIVAGRWIGFLE